MSERKPPTESELVALVRSIDARAPEQLHRRVDALIDERSAPRPRPRRSPWTLRLGASAVAISAAAVVLALVLSLSGGGTQTLSLRQASALTLRAPTMPGPGESPSDPAHLAANVDGVAFPYWEERFGWRSSGERVDRVGGRTVTTVFYTSRGARRIGYAIVAGSPPPPVHGGMVAWRDGTAYRLMRAHGAHVVTWVRNGHMCVVSGRGVNSATLLRLASWEDGVSA